MIEIDYDYDNDYDNEHRFDEYRRLLKRYSHPLKTRKSPL